MKRLFVPLMFFIIVLTTNAFAIPTEVILYPSGATIAEEMTLPKGEDSISVLLPNVAIPQSIKMELQAATQQKITSIEYESILLIDPKFKELDTLISELIQKINIIDDQINSQTLTLNYWKSRKDTQLETLSDIRAMGKIIKEETASLLQETTELKDKKIKLEIQLDEARAQLQQKTGNNQRNWQVRIRLSKPTTEDYQLVYSYRIRHAGWKSIYSLNALPKREEIEWTWTAKIIQQTGIDWNGVGLKIATNEPVFTLTPPTARSWNITEKHISYARSTKMAMAMPEVMTMNAVADREEIAVPPRDEGQLFDIYDLGSVNIVSGKEARIKIREGLWKAEFNYLARPLLSEQVFLEADLDLTNNFLPLPSGTASIQVDGVHVGERNFALHEKKNVSMSFGSDPGIVVDVQTDHVASEKGLLSKKRTYNWNWTLNFENNKNFSLKLKVEDSYPHIGHGKILLQESFSAPLPTREKDILTWNLTIPAQGRKKVKYGYLVTYPEDLPVSLGR